MLSTRLRLLVAKKNKKFSKTNFFKVLGGFYLIKTTNKEGSIDLLPFFYVEFLNNNDLLVKYIKLIFSPQKILIFGSSIIHQKRWKLVVSLYCIRYAKNVMGIKIGHTLTVCKELEEV